MELLFTAFKGKNNTSFQLVTALQTEHILLTNSFQGVEKDITRLQNDYDAVIMIGAEKTLKKSIRIEGRAEHNGTSINSSFHTETLAQRCDELRIPYNISFSPTKYLCNAAYWHMLHKNPNTVFIHIPTLGGMDEDFMKSLVDLFMGY